MEHGEIGVYKYVDQINAKDILAFQKKAQNSPKLNVSL